MIETECTSGAPRLSMAKPLFHHSVHRRAGIFDIRHSGPPRRIFDLIRHSGFGIRVLCRSAVPFTTRAWNDRH
jgi:hypothetical protein